MPFRMTPGRCCCGDGPPPPPPCTVTFNLRHACGGAPIPGATVRITKGSAPGADVVDGTTDGSGDFSIGVPVGAAWFYKVSYGCRAMPAGLGAPFGPENCGTIKLCYCTGTFHLTYEPADALVRFDGEEFSDDPQIGAEAVRTGSPGDYTFTLCSISRCSNYVAKCAESPGKVYVYKPGYVTACAPWQLQCGSDTSADLSPYLFAGCYLAGGIPEIACAETNAPDYRGLICAVNDNECNPYPGPDGVALTPLALQARLTPFGPLPGSRTCTLFADDAGQWIDLPMSANVLQCVSGQARGRIISWSTGCRGGMGNFNAVPFGGFDCVQEAPYTPDTLIQPFQSTSVAVEAFCSSRQSVPSSATFTYSAFGKPDCVGRSSSDPTSIPASRFFQVTLSFAEITAIVDITRTVTLSPGFGYTLEIREVPC